MHTSRRPSARAAARRAFTLLEMMLVLLIIALLASVAAYNLIAGADKAREDATKASIKTMEGALKQYYFATGAYPPTDTGLIALVPTYLQKPALDGWKREFRYYSPAPNGADFAIISDGKDALPDTDDDIRSWELE